MRTRGLNFLRQITGSLAMVDTEALGELGVVAAYIVRGKENALIDMGYQSSAQTVIKDLAACGLGSEDVDYLLPTHVHLDHCGSCGTLASVYSNATVRVHPRGQPHLSDPSRLVAGARDLFGEELMSRYGLPDPISANRVRSVSDNEEIALGDGITLRAIWTPGHAPHHVSYLIEEHGILFTGDAIGVQYPAFPVQVPTSPPPSFNLVKAVESIERIRSFSPAKLCTPHFGLLDKANESLERNLKTLVEWEAKLEKLLSENSDTDEIVTILTNEIREDAQASFSDLPEYLRTTIMLSVMGFLGYLKWNAEQ